MIIGIDLGTTNSLVAVYRDSGVQLVPNPLNEYLTPSVVSVDDNDELLVGRAARDRLITQPNRTVANFKRFMGSDQEIRMGKLKLRPEELSSLVLRQLKADAEHYLGEPVSEAVISVPAYFNDAQRRATRTAGELAGLKVERLINEPTAAALAYGLNEAEDESTFLVFDLGGGTFDVSVLEWFDEVMEVHAVAGDNFLGGEDFVDVLVSGFYNRTGLEPSRLDATQRSRVRAMAESAKRALNTEHAVKLRLALDDGEHSCEVTADEYLKLCEPLLQRLRYPVERALRDARLSVSDIDYVVLVGGSTRKLLVQKLVTNLFGQLPLRHINPDEVVARGAAVQAGLKTKNEGLKDVVLVDVCPYTLGFDITRSYGQRRLYNLFEPVIERNTVVPVSREKRVYPLKDNQTGLTINVYQGESRQTVDNIKLGTLKCRLPRLPADDNPVDIRFTYDVNGLLEVEAKAIASGEAFQLVIQQGEHTLSPDEVQQRLAALAELKIHPREKAENRSLLEQARRLHEEYLGVERETIAEHMDVFLLALESQNEQEIQRAREALQGLVETMEPHRL